MSQRMMRLALATTGLLALGFPALGQDTAKKPVPPDTSKIMKEKPKPDPKIKSVESLRMAADLVTYGREAKSPEALILAAKILAATPVKEGAGSAKLVEGSAKSDKNPADEGVSPATLLDEAKKMTDDEHVLSMISDTRKIIAERSKGEIDGPAQHQGFAPGNGSQTWTAVFLGNQPASVTIAGYGGADFDLYVYDDRGNLVHSDTGPTFNAGWTWYPPYTMTYSFVVRNCSPFGANYRFINN